jgi:hypothetical protein
MRQARRKNGRQKCLLRQPARLCGISQQSIIEEYLAQLDTPRSLTVKLIFAYGDHKDLLNLDTDVDGEVFTYGVDHARRSYAATKLLKKADFLNVDIDREKVALDGGLEAERLNRVTNSRLRDLREGLVKDPEFNAILHRAASIVARILGPIDVALTRIVDHGWTPGRTSAVDSRHRSPQQKYQANLEVSASAFVYGKSLVNSSPMWAAAAIAADGPCCLLDRAFALKSYNTAITVPKSAKTDRLICYEPHINIRLQRSVGVYLAQRLKTVGIDLGDQSLNQYFAKWGSVTGQLATIDLSMASDTLSYELVFDLVPYEWFKLLDDLRSRYTQWPHGLSLNEKFSSMGNGFTFELETICFYALCVASSSTEWALVYGDDIVIDSRDFQRVTDALSKAGFSVNPQKSFGTGRFRESCGEDYWSGVSFKAPHLDREIKECEDIVAFHNQVYTWLFRDTLPHISWSRLLKRWRKTVNDNLVKHGLKTVPYGPLGFGNGHFACTFDEAKPARHPDGWDGYIFYSIIKVFPRGLVTTQVSNDDCFEVKDRFTNSLINSWAILCAMLGPQGTFNVQASIQASKHVSEKRSPLFAKEWPSVTYTS